MLLAICIQKGYRIRIARVPHARMHVYVCVCACVVVLL